MKLSQLGEFGLIDKLSKIVGKTSGQVMVGIGDDCAAIEIPSPKHQITNNTKIQNSKSKTLLLITTDTLVENTHFKQGKVSFQALGYKALAVNVSDIAAMGGIPTCALVTIGANKKLDVKNIEELYKGIKKLAKKHKIQIIGGDTVQAKDFMISITLIGEVEKECLLTRAGAKVGNAILVTGSFGGPAAEKYESRKLKAFRQSSGQVVSRKLEARIIAKSRMASAMIDSSDGLVRSVLEICKASQVGARIFLGSVPIAKGATLEHALYGGEEYELVFIVPKPKAAKLAKLVQRKAKTKVKIVGEVVAKKQKVRLIDDFGDISVPKEGFEHFK